MKRKKSPEGFRKKLIAIRLTEPEYEHLAELYENARTGNEGLLICDFMRSQLLYENSESSYKNMINELRKIKTELHQALAYSRSINDADAVKNLTAAVDAADKKVAEMKEVINGWQQQF